MKAIELWDVNRHIFLSLAEIFAALPRRAILSTWAVSDFVYPDGRDYFQTASNGEDPVARLRDNGARVTGNEFAFIAKSNPQVIWATFRGYEPDDASEPWIVLHAIDSTFWRCETRDIPTRQALMKNFKDVRLKE